MEKDNSKVNIFAFSGRLESVDESSLRPGLANIPALKELNNLL